MWKNLGLLPLFLATARAFRDSSPFFFYSASGEVSHPQPELIAARTLLPHLTAQLSECQSEAYIVVSQPRVSAADYHRLEGSTPQLDRILRQEHGSSYAITDVVGQLDVDALVAYLQTKCAASLTVADTFTPLPSQSSVPHIIQINYDAPDRASGRLRKEKLLENDSFLSTIVDTLHTNKYTVLYTTTPLQERHPTEAALPTKQYLRRRDSVEEDPDSPMNRSVPESAPLFEKYQYFTPGLFMSLVVVFIMLLAISVGISGISGLQVTYAAFDKDTSTQAKKQQ